MLVKDNKFAVLISYGFGAGWSSWCNDKAVKLNMCTDETLVRAVIQGDKEGIKKVIKERFPSESYADVDQLNVEWVDVGSKFKITDHDGDESIEIDSSGDWMP